MELVLLGNRVAILPDEPERMSAGGLVIPETAQKKSQIGSVVATGPGKWLNDQIYLTPEVVVGDRVFFSQYAGIELDVGGQLVYVYEATDIYAKVQQ